jgi:hypothetical protein
MASVMPVKPWMLGGMPMPGLTRLDQRSTSSPFSTRRMAISVTRSTTGLAPVVSTSMKARRCEQSAQLSVE